ALDDDVLRDRDANGIAVPDRHHDLLGPFHARAPAHADDLEPLLVALDDAANHVREHRARETGVSARLARVALAHDLRLRSLEIDRERLVQAESKRALRPGDRESV